MATMHPSKRTSIANKYTVMENTGLLIMRVRDLMAKDMGKTKILVLTKANLVFTDKVFLKSHAL